MTDVGTRAIRMLNRQSTSISPARPPPAFGPPPWSRELGIPDITSFLRRRWTPIALAVIAFLVLAGVYLLLATPVYTATTLVVIDTRKLEIFETGDVAAEEVVTNAQVETELEILRSRQIAAAVVDILDLTQNPTFMQSGGGLVSATVGQIRRTVSRLLRTPASREAGPASDNPREDRAIAILTKNMEIDRVGLSYAITIAYASADPQQAARIANGIAEAYLQDQRNRQVDEARRLAEWLSARIKELRAQSLSPGLSAEEKSALRLTHDSFVQRHTEAIQQQSLPAAQARVVTKAVAPKLPTWPNSLLVMGAAIVLGGAFGVAAAVTRDLLDSKIRSRQQLASAIQAPFLGFLPRFRLGWGRSRRQPAEFDPEREDRPRVFAVDPEASVSLTAPLSLFAETLRSIKVAADNLAEGPANVIGIVSSAPMEGKTTVAVNLARLVAGDFSNVLLVDADLRHPTLSRKLVPPAAPGLIQAVSDGVSVDGLLWSDPSTHLQFLPAGTETGIMNSGEILGSGRINSLIVELRTRFSFIVVDLPPLLPVVDVRAAATWFDGFVFVVEWGVTTADDVSRAAAEGAIEGKVIGTILNKVHLRQLRRYDPQSHVRSGDGYIGAYPFIG
jgi:Mrp family chromosome partitioning ATPase/capsular polysaccharide biosynthesis protein